MRIPVQYIKLPKVVIPSQSGKKEYKSGFTDTSGGSMDSVRLTTQANKSFGEILKARWKDHGLGAPFKAVSEYLVKNPSEPVSKAGIIGWLKILIALPMEILGSTIGFFSNIVTNTGPELKNIFGGKKTPEQQPKTQNTTINKYGNQEKEKDETEPAQKPDNQKPAESFLKKE